MALWPDRRRVCVVLPLVGLLLFCIYSMMLKEPKYKRRHFAKDEDILFDLDDDFNSSLDKFKLSTQMTNSSTRQNTYTKHNGGKRRQKRLPNAIIIGVRKGGTRALLEFLKIHPKIKACSPEVHFFDNDNNYKRGLEWYREQMPKSLPGDITIEKTPAYFVTDKVPERVYQMNPTVKLIVTLRDPTERAISDYVQVLSKKNRALPPFEEFITTDEEQKVLRTSAVSVKIGVYVKHLRNWLKYLPISQLHFVSMEEMKVNLAKELQDVEKFLNIEPFIKKKHFYINETKHFPCRTVHDVENDANSGCLSENKGRNHPSVRDDIRKLLQDYYRPYNKELYEEVQRDFNWP